MNDLKISSPSNQLLESILGAKPYWKILLVDDRAYFHKLTKVILKNFKFENKPLKFISAYSGQEAEDLITANPDVAVILLDVVMETSDAGLRVVKYIREKIKNKLVRIILRTGNPEEAPEESVIIDYDINDYKTKGELTHKKLITTMVAALRSYRDVRDLLKIRLKLQDANRDLENKVKLRTRELEARNLQLQQEIQERQRTELALKKLKEELEIRVEQRTSQLINLNQKLRQEIEVRNEIETTLRSSEHKYRSLVENLSDGIYLITANERPIYFNPAIANIFGRARDYLLDLRPDGFLECIHPEDREMVVQSFGTHPLSEDWLEVNYRIVTDSGEIRYLRDRRLAIKERDGKVEAYQGIISDLTAIKQTQLALEFAKETADATNRAKSEFLANMSHEIRTPMNAILGFSELLQPLVTEPKQLFYLQSIASSGKTLLALIDDILDLSRIEAGKLQLHYESVNLRLLIEEVVQIFSDGATKKNLSLVTEIDPNLPTAITFDQVRLRQILFNVLGNALKFTEQGHIKITVKILSVGAHGSTTLSAGLHFDRCNPGPADKLRDRVTEPQKITLELEVEDTGIGIATEQQDRIFHAFIQSEGQSTRKYGGTGLGLGITKRLTEMLGGTVSLSSELGRGSTFTFIFPEVVITKCREATADEIPTLSSAPDFDEDLEQFGRAKVLVVDDVESNRDLMKGYFDKSKHQLLVAEDGEEGIKLARQEKPDLILLDLLMPNTDGYSAARQLKQDRETKDIPIIILTASSSRKDEENLQSLCQGFLCKPFSRHQLVCLFKQVLSKEDHDEKESSSEQLGRREAITADARAKLPELVAKLEEIEETLWPQLCQTMKMKDLHQLSECLQQWGQEYQCPPLLEYATTLATQIQEFDGEGLPKTIEAFPELRRGLEILYSGSQEIV